MIKIAPSILSADFADMGRAVEKLAEWGADYVHVDVMDGSFVPNITFGQGMVKAIRKHTKLPLDVHLMINTPERHIDSFIDAGADILTIHVEATNHVHRALQNIRKRGIKAGVSLNPSTPPQTIQYILDMLDLVLVMSVNPGFGGQKFIPSAVDKIEAIYAMMKGAGANFEIEVDGGIAPDTAPLVKAAGANVLVAGNAVFTAEDPKKMIATLRG